MIWEKLYVEIQGVTWPPLPLPGGAHATVYVPKQYRAYRLDRFWSDQEVLYDYKTDLHGIVNRSIV